MPVNNGGLAAPYQHSKVGLPFLFGTQLPKQTTFSEIIIFTSNNYVEEESGLCRLTAHHGTEMGINYLPKQWAIVREVG